MNNLKELNDFSDIWNILKTILQEQNLELKADDQIKLIAGLKDHFVLIIRTDEEPEPEPELVLEASTDIDEVLGDAKLLCKKYGLDSGRYMVDLAELIQIQDIRVSDEENSEE